MPGDILQEGHRLHLVRLVFLVTRAVAALLDDTRLAVRSNRSAPVCTAGLCLWANALQEGTRRVAQPPLIA